MNTRVKYLIGYIVSSLVFCFAIVWIAPKVAAEPVPQTCKTYTADESFLYTGSTKKIHVTSIPLSVIVVGSTITFEVDTSDGYGNRSQSPAEDQQHESVVLVINGVQYGDPTPDLKDGVEFASTTTKFSVVVDEFLLARLKAVFKTLEVDIYHSSFFGNPSSKWDSVHVPKVCWSVTDPVVTTTSSTVPVTSSTVVTTTSSTTSSTVVASTTTVAVPVTTSTAVTTTTVPVTVVADTTTTVKPTTTIVTTTTVKTVDSSMAQDCAPGWAFSVVVSKCVEVVEVAPPANPVPASPTFTG